MGSSARRQRGRARVFDEQGSCAGYRRAIDEYRASLTQSPPYRIAWRSFADALVASAVLGCLSTPAAFASLDEVVRRASPLARTEHAYVGGTRALFVDRDLPRAGLLLGEAHGRAAGRSADVTVAAYMVASGQLDSAIDEAQRARLRNPAAVGENWSVAMALYFARRFDEAAAVLDAARELHPDSSFLRHLQLLVLLETTPAEARERAQARQASEFDRLSFADAYVLAKTGDRAAAARIAAQWEAEASARWVPATAMAAIYRALGDGASFTRWMRVAESEHDAWLVFRHVDPTLSAHDQARR
jgi:tetratricopeptide (TPR) repeat protein